MITISVIPVPIPNTEVKRNSAEDTCGLPCWENRLSLDFFILTFTQYCQFIEYSIYVFIKYILIRFFYVIAFLYKLCYNIKKFNNI